VSEEGWRDGGREGGREGGGIEGLERVKGEGRREIEMGRC